MGTIDTVTWYVLGLMLTGAGLVWTYLRWQRKGLAAGVRGLAWSLLPLALALTGTLELVGEIADDVVRWATHLVFSPVVWLGIGLAGVSAVLFVLSGWLTRRPGAPQTTTATAKQLPERGRREPAVPVDDDMADIEAILRKHGIQ